MSKKIRKNKKKTSKGVLERILGAGRFPLQTRQAVAKELRLFMSKEHKVTVFKSTLKRLMLYPVVKEHFLAFKEKISINDVGTKKIYHLNQLNLLALYSSSFINQKEKLKGFSKKINTFERLFLIGNLTEADNYLEEIKTETGETLWYIRSKISILSEQEKKEELLAFCASLKERASQPIVEYIVDCLFWLATSSQTQITLERFVLKVIREYTEAGLETYVGTLSILFLPIGKYEDRNIYRALGNFQLFSLYDQYLMTLQWVEEILSIDNIDETSENKELLLCWLRELSDEIDDGYLKILIGRLEQQDDFIPVEKNDDFISMYNVGDYEQLINSFRNKIDEIENPFAYINLVSKSIAYIDYIVTEKTPIFKIIKYLVNIYSLKETANQSLTELHSLSINLNHFRSAPSFITSLINAAPSRPEIQFISYINRLCYLTQGEITQLNYESAKQTITDQHERVFFLSYIRTVSDNLNLPDYRILKARFIEQLKTGYFNKNILNKISTTEPLRKDFYELKILALIFTRQYKEVIEFIAEIVTEHEQAEICIPLSFIMEVIETECFISIDAAIICYKYFESVSQEKGYLLHEIVEELLTEQRARKPSEYLNNTPNQLSQKEVFFFEQVCIRDVIDYLACFDSSNDLALERLKIISILDSKNIKLQEKTKLETQEIFNDIIIDSNVAKIGSSKVYVGVDGIKRDKAAEVSALIGLYEISAADNQEEKYIILDNYNDNEITQALVTSDKNSVLIKIMESLLIPFIHDEEFGLDKNLSAEIRHGFFSNLMRSKLEDASLILETNNEGKYITPEYWEENLNFIKDELKQNILGHLIWFTESFNQLLEKAEEWMKITTDLKDKSRLFSFIITSDDLENFSSYIEVNKDYSYIIDYILNLYWEKTEECLDNVRRHIDEELKDEIDILFNELFSRVNQDKGGASLVDFMDAIERAKNGIREDLQTVSDWFHRSSGIVFEDVGLNTLIEIAVKTLRSYNSRNFELNLVLDPSCHEKRVKGKDVKSIVLALVNFLDNAVKYSDVQKPCNVIIDVVTVATSTGYVIYIKNKIAQELLHQIENSNYLEKQITKMKNQELNHLVRSEGGSGLKKAYHKLRAADNLFDVTLSVEGDIFNVIIMYGN